MALFGGSGDSLFELLGRGRHEAPPPSNVQGVAGTKTPPPQSRQGLLGRRLPDRPQLERVLSELLEDEGDPILVIDDELDPAEAAREEQEAAEASTLRNLVVRLDTAVVGGIVLSVVIAIAYLSGRQTTKPATPDKAPVEAVVAAPPPAEAPPEASPAPKRVATPEVSKSAEAPAPTTKPDDAVAPARAPKEGKHELLVVSTSEEKAKAVADYLNQDPKSPIAGRQDLEAYVRRSATGGSAGVRIRGFEKRDDGVLAKIQTLQDPTSRGGAAFASAMFFTVKKEGR